MLRFGFTVVWFCGQTEVHSKVDNLEQEDLNALNPLSHTSQGEQDDLELPWTSVFLHIKWE